MHEENLHIIPTPEKGYPRPEVPADEAWNNMAELLDASMPVPPSEPPAVPPKLSPKAGGSFFGSSQFWVIVGGIVIIGGALTWGIISFTGKTEMPATGIETKTAETISTNAIEPVEPIINKGTALEKNEIILANENTVQPVAAKPPDTKTRIEKPSANVPLQTVPADITNPVEDKPSSQEPINDSIIKDTVKIAESQSQPDFPVADTVKKADKPSTVENPPANAPKEIKQENANTPMEPGKAKNKAGKAGNLDWQLAINGNLGEVVQGGRDANPFYGGMVTGGLWHEKLKGGIETGVGYEVYEDYSSVNENIRVDSIPVDTMGHYEFLDSTRFTSYKYRYNYVNVPLFITKQLISKGRFSFDLKTGPLIGFMISEKKTLDYITGPAGGEILGTEDNYYQRLDISWQWHIIPQFRWNFNDRLSLSLSPYGIFYLNNLYDKSDRPSGMPFGFGANIGLIYRFR